MLVLRGPNHFGRLGPYLGAKSQTDLVDQTFRLSLLAVKDLGQPSLPQRQGNSELDTQQLSRPTKLDILNDVHNIDNATAVKTEAKAR